MTAHPDGTRLRARKSIRWLLLGGSLATAALGVLVWFPSPREPAHMTSVGTATAPAGGRFVVHERPQPLPDIEFVDGDNQPHRLSDFRGKVLLLNVWATWCVPCRKEMPQLDALQGQLGSDDFEVLALSIDRGGLFVVKAFFDEIDAQHLRLFIDAAGQVSRALNVIGLPTTLLADRDGRELGRLIGPTDWHSSEITKLLGDILARSRTSRGHPLASSPAAT